MRNQSPAAGRIVHYEEARSEVERGLGTPMWDADTLTTRSDAHYNATSVFSLSLPMLIRYLGCNLVFLKNYFGLYNEHFVNK